MRSNPYYQQAVHHQGQAIPSMDTPCNIQLMPNT
jgi:hypothetical protein